MTRHRSPKQRLLAFAHGFILFIACLVVIVPLVYLVINSVKLPREFLTVPPTILPTQVTTEHYQDLIEDKKTIRYFRNSLTVALWTTGITIITGTLAGIWAGAHAALRQGIGCGDLCFSFHPLLSARDHGHTILFGDAAV